MYYMGYEGVRQIALDHVWTAMRFKKADKIPSPARASLNGATHAPVEGVNYEKRAVQPPSDFIKQLKHSKIASHFFDKLSFTNKKEYVSWISPAPKNRRQGREDWKPLSTN